MNDTTGGYTCAFCPYTSFDLHAVVHHEEVRHEEEIRAQHHAEWGHDLGSAECRWHYEPDGAD